MTNFKLVSAVVYLLAALTLTGCATTYKDFKTSKVKPDEGVAIGKVLVKYNGQDLTKDCAVCFNSTNGPCQMLTSEGFVFQNLKKGVSTIRRVQCKDVSVQHYNIEGAQFIQEEGVTYIGDITIDWDNKGGFKPSQMFGLVGALISESKNDGKIRMTVAKNEMKNVVRAYEAQTSTKLQPVVNLVKAGQ